MKYLPLREIDTVANALNFSTLDIHVIGGCDIYTTKAAGGDKKLYKSIENNLESQHESLVRFSASLSPPYRPAGSDDGKTSSRRGSSRSKRGRSVEALGIDLSRASPFGPLSQISARRTFAYLVATMNASHPDYDFSHILRPTDFRKERSLQRVMASVDSTLHNLRRRSSGVGTAMWGPKMWAMLDKEMGLRQCEKYSYAPKDDLFDDGEGALWSMHYFFFNKEKKRVAYLYVRGLSVISHSPINAPIYMQPPRKVQRTHLSVGDGAGKRASYWLGSGAELNADGSAENDDDDEMILPGDDEVDAVPYMDLDEIRGEVADGYPMYDDVFDDAYLEDGWKPVRGMSEEPAWAMDL